MKKNILLIATSLVLLANEKIPVNDLNSKLELGKNYYLRGDFKNAKNYFLEILQEDRNNKTAINYLKKIYKKEQLDLIFKKYYTHDYNKIVNLLFSTEKYDELIHFYRLVDNVNLFSDNSLIKIAKAYMIKKNYYKSLEVLSHIRNKNLDYHILSAYNYYYLKDYKNAKPYFEILYANTGNSEYAYKLLYIYSQLKDISNFNKLYLKLKQKGLNVSYYDKTYAYFNSDNFKENNSKYIINIFNQYYKNNQKLQAFNYLKNYIHDRPDDYKVKLFYANMLIKENRIDEAKKVLFQIPTPEAKLVLADIYKNYENYKKALELYYEILMKGNSKQKYKASLNIADIYIREKKFSKALEILYNLKKIYPNDIAIQEYILIATHKFTPLIQEYTNLIKKYPNNAVYRKILAYIFSVKGDYRKAIELYKNAISLNPKDISLYKEIGKLYLKLGDYNKGFRYLQTWSNLDKSKDAKLLLAKYRSLYNSNRRYSYNSVAGASAVSNINYSTPNHNTLPPLINKFIYSWKKAWESRDIDIYSLYYDPRVFDRRWKYKKKAIFRRASYIKVDILDPRVIYKKGNIYKVEFFQIYKTNYKKDEGYKTLTLKCSRKFCQIIDEKWRRGTYHKPKIAYHTSNIVSSKPPSKLSSLENYLDSMISKYDTTKSHDNYNDVYNNYVSSEKKEAPQKTIIANKVSLKSKTPLNVSNSYYLAKDDIDTETILKAYNQNLNNAEDTIRNILHNRISLITAYEIKDDLNLINTPYITKSHSIETSIEGDFATDDEADFFKYKAYVSYKGFKAILSQFYISEKDIDIANFYYGIGYKNLNYDIELTYDNANSKIGFLANLFSNNYSLSFERKNLVYERESAYATTLMDNILKFSIFTKIPKFNNYFSGFIKYESISDDNTALTAYLNANLYNLHKLHLKTKFNFEIQYQTHSKQTSHYYSDSSADKSFLSTHIIYNLPYKNILDASFKLGYSMHAESMVYETKIMAFKASKELKYKFAYELETIPLYQDTLIKNKLVAEIEKEW